MPEHETLRTRSGGDVMRNVSLQLVAIAGAVLFVSMSTGVRADLPDKLTYLTFSGPVQVPGATLAAGTYRFRVAPSTASVVQVLNQQGTHAFAMFYTERTAPHAVATRKPLIFFYEHVANRPDVIREFVYSNELYGYKFMYGAHENPLTLAANAESLESGSSARLAFPCNPAQAICR
jgi:hypothetical protein